MPATRYTHTAIFIHWLMALLLIGLFSVGLYMSDPAFVAPRS
jgi:cytochrome b561